MSLGPPPPSRANKNYPSVFGYVYVESLFGVYQYIDGEKS